MELGYSNSIEIVYANGHTSELFVDAMSLINYVFYMLCCFIVTLKLKVEIWWTINITLLMYYYD